MTPSTSHPARPVPFLRPLALSLALAGTALAVAACGEEPPALTVGPIGYSQDALLGFTDTRKEELARLAAFGLVVADSAALELGRPVVDGWLDERRLEILAAEKVLEEAGVGDDVLEARYLTDPEYELTVRHILFFSERWRPDAHRDEARRKAERALVSLREGADFAETAARLSEEPGAEGREGAWVDEFWAAASALDVGEISPVTETQYGFHILRLEDREIVPFQEGRSIVARDVADQVGDPSAWLQAWEEDPDARSAALAEAEDRGLAVPPGEVEEIERRWTDRTNRWAAALGFASGMGTDEVAAAALEALARTGQNAAIAREELAAHADLLEARYAVDLAPGEG